MLVDSEVNLNNSGVIIPDGMLAKVAGQNRFKVGNGVSTWSKLEYISSIALGNGLAFDENGQIVVDFSVMPTEKFEQLLKSIWVPIKLTANKNFYVDGAKGSDTLSAGRGESVNAPFKTIQACVNYVCDNYNLSRYNVYINISDGTYKENLILPDYNTNIGYITLKPKTINSNGEYTVTITNVSNSSARVILINSTKSWSLSYLKIVFSIIPEKRDVFYASCISVQSTATINLYGISFNIECSDIDNFSVSTLGVGSFLGLSYGAKCYFNNTSTHNYEFYGLQKSIKNVALYGLNLASNSGLYFQLTNTDTDILNIFCSGYTSVFALVNNSTFDVVGVGSYTFKFIQNETSYITGKKFSVTNSGKINTHGRGLTYFPGTIDGTIELDAGSYYK